VRLRQSAKVKYKTEGLGRANYSAKPIACQVFFWSKVQLCVRSLVSAKVQKRSAKTICRRRLYHALTVVSSLFFSKAIKKFVKSFGDLRGVIATFRRILEEKSS